ncbi:G-protein alpha subunit-domain-containing protein [Pseudomassariella vexata]|uniref:G-protein alpha subunit-domain-containing protein n=1 Tax=Pseudomassariella vexata TaxID=1141098 RepID=A0A1Y2EL02_9PEZI|nr:G-protein alpha subunit-domain-containing protein [Pseudomassariella vexata]ORY71966.1 G-protein alpha subunit-domain-containing protein [Pseudomassariella vexata]
MALRDGTEPVALLATAGTLTNIVAILGRSIVSVAELRSQWNDADLAILSFESQLASLRTALVKINEWVDTHYAEDPHHQLVMDLDRCVACCRLLISKVDTDIHPFQMLSGKMDKKHKAKMLLKSKDFRDTQRMIEQHTSALSLLLTACHTTALSQQQVILGKPHARKVFEKMEDDAASLFVHLDTDSVAMSTAPTTIRSSKRSLKFDFDKELLVSKIYERWIRGSVKKCLRDEQPPKNPGGAFELEAPDRACLGVVSQTGSYSASERPMPELQGSVASIEAPSDYNGNTISELESPSGVLNPRTQSYNSSTISQHESPYGTNSTTSSAVDSPFSTALFGSRQTTSVNTSPSSLDTPATRWRRFPSLRKMPTRNYTASDNSSIRARAKKMQCDYEAVLVGSESRLEIFHAISAKHMSRKYAEQELINVASTGALEARLELGKRSIHLVNIVDETGDWHEWQPLLESTAFLLFVMDLDTYDEEDKMKETLSLFEEIVKSNFFLKASVILILNNKAGFREKLQWKALSDCFPDYTGGSDYHKAVEYIIWKFNMLNSGRFIMYPCVTKSDDPSGLDSMSTVMQEAIINYVLRGAKLLA